jgi:hypothetical protein
VQAIEIKDERDLPRKAEWHDRMSVDPVAFHVDVPGVIAGPQAPAHVRKRVADRLEAID